jgi:hypothetical protein
MPVYTHPNGLDYTEEQIQTAADKAGISIDDYVKTKKLTPKQTKTKPVKQKSAFPTTPELDILGVEKMKTAPASKPVVKRPTVKRETTEELSFFDSATGLVKEYTPNWVQNLVSTEDEYKAIPKADKEKAYVKEVSDIINARDTYSSLANLPKEERVTRAAMVQPPLYANKKITQETKDDVWGYIREYQPDKTEINKIMQELPEDINSYDEGKVDSVLQKTLSNRIEKDPAMLLAKQKAMLDAKKYLDSNINSIKSKYDLTNPEDVIKAQDELKKIFNEKVNESFDTNPNAKRLLTTYNTLASAVSSRVMTNYGRANDWFLSLTDKARESDYVPDVVADLPESIVKGAIGMYSNAKKALVSTNAGDVKELESLKSQISGKKDTEPLNREFANTWKLNDLSVYDPSQQDVPKTYGEAKKRLDTYISNTKGLVGERVKDIGELDKYSELFKNADLKDGIQFTDVVRLLGENAPNMASTAVGTITGNPLLIGLGVASSIGQTYGNEYYAAIQQGLQDDLNREPTEVEIAEAIEDGKYADRAEAFAYSALSGSLEYASDAFTLGKTAKALGLGGSARKAIGSLYKGEIKAFAKSILTQGVDAAKSGLGEFLTEGAQEALDQISVASQLNEPITKHLNIDNIIDGAVAGGLIGTVLPLGGTTISQSTTELRNMARDVSTKFNINNDLKLFNSFFKDYEKTLNEKLKIGDINQDQYKVESDNLRDMRNAGMSVPSNFSEDAKKQSFELVMEKNSLQREIDGKDPALVTPQKERIKTIDSQLNNIAVQQHYAGRYEEEIERLKTLTKASPEENYGDTAIGEGKKFHIIESSKDTQTNVEQWLTDQGLESELYEKDEKGNILIDDKGNKVKVDFASQPAITLPNGQIVINKESAMKVDEGGSVGRHEILHKILKSQFNDPVNGKSLLNKFRSTLSKKENEVINKRLSDRGYSEDYLDKSPDEYLTQFFEALEAKELTFLDSTFKNMWNSIFRPIYRKLGFGKLDFEDGKDIYNFLKDYHKTSKKGKLTGRQKSLLEAGKGITGNFKSSKSVYDRMDDLDDRLNADEIDQKNYDAQMKVLEAEADALESGVAPVVAPATKEKVKESSKEKVSKEEDENTKIVENNKGAVASNKVQEVYDAKGIEGAFEIIKQFKPITSKLVDKRRDAPGFDKELLTDELETGSGGLYDLIKSYDPNSGVPLAAYINKYLPMRAIAASKRILAKEFSKEIMDDSGSPAYDMEDDYSFDSTLDEIRDEEDRKSRLINPIDIMGPVLANKYNKEVSNKVNNMSPKELSSLTFANLNDLAPNVTAEFFGTTLRKVTDAKANLATPEIPVIQKIIYDNKIKLIKLLPEGAILEGTPARENLINTGLNIPRKLQQLFYDQKERLGKGAGLIPFELKKNITQKDFLNAFGINEDGTFEKFGGQDPRSQTILAMIRLYGRIASNTAVRVEAEQSIENLQDLKAGTSQVQFSKTKLAVEKKFSIDYIDSALEALNTFSIDALVMDNKEKPTYINYFNKILIPKGIIPIENYYYRKNHKQFFYADDLISMLEEKQKVYPIFPKEIADQKMLIKGLTGNSTRTDGTNANLYEGKTVVADKKGNQIKSPKTINRIKYLNSNETINSILGTKPIKYSEATKTKISEYNEELKKLRTKYPSSNFNLTSKKLTEIKNALTNTPNDIDGINAMLAELSEFNKINKLTAEIFIHTLRDWVNQNNITKATSDSRLRTVAYMLIGNSQISDGLRSLAGLTGIVVDTNPIVDEKFKYKVEHEDSMLTVCTDILQNIADNVQDIEFNATSKIVPSSVGNARDANIQLKLSDKNTYRPWLKDYVASQDGKYTLINTKQENVSAGIKFSKALSTEFNKILEETRGIGENKQFSDITARTLGVGKGKFRVFMSPAAEDFAGLLYDFMGKGKRGEEQKKFFEDNLLTPYATGVTRINNIRANIKQGYRDLKKEYPAEASKLKKVIDGTSNTYDQAVRVYLWDKNNVEIPGLSNDEISELVKAVEADPKLVEFANKLSEASGQLEGWIKPSEYWNVESIVSDLHNVTEKSGRKQILSEFVDNADAIFSPENLNKIEAARGTDFREALEDSLFRMKNGTNRSSTDKFAGAWASWVNNSSGAIMFLNTRSAVLQLIASTNFINLSDNNPISAAAAFADQPQYWKDFAELWNSNSLKERRSGLKSDVDQAELANAVKGSKNKVKAALSYLLKIGYTPTQMADSFAICSGGAAFYRNRIDTYKKQGLSEEDAKSKAFQDFLATSEESQQSADPSKISQQQASSIGRIILAFGNTPMQYNRLMKKAARDLINGRGDAKTHISKILYYGFVQNMIFSSLQAALFAMVFDDEPEDEKGKLAKKEKESEKYSSIANSMLDTILRGTGVYGAIVSTVKNTLNQYIKQEKKGFKGDQAKTIISALGISPPIGSKAQKLYSAIQTYTFDKDVIKKEGFSLTKDGKFSPSPTYDIAGKLTAATTNFPLDRLVDKANNVAEILDERNALWQKVALGFGWKPFDVGVKNEEEELIKAEAKATRKFESAVKSVETRQLNKEALANRIEGMTDAEMDAYIDSIANAKEKAAAKKMMIWERVEKNKNK